MEKKKEDSGSSEAGGNSPPEEHKHVIVSMDTAASAGDTVNAAKNLGVYGEMASNAMDTLRKASSSEIIQLHLNAPPIAEAAAVPGLAVVAEEGAEMMGKTGKLLAQGSVNGAVSGISLVNGIMELDKAWNDPNANASTIGAGVYNVVTGGANLTASVMQISCRELSGAAEGGLRGLGVAGLIIGSGVNIANAKPEDKAFVATTEGMKDTVAAGVMLSSSTVLASLGLTGLAAAATPIVLAAGVTVAVDLAVDKVADDRKTYQRFQKNNELQKAAYRDEEGPRGKAPTPGDYRNLLYGAREASGNIDWSKIKGAEPLKKEAIEVDLIASLNPTAEQAKVRQAAMDKGVHDVAKSGAKDGKPDINTLKASNIDLSIPENRKEVERALDVEIAKQKQLMAIQSRDPAAYLTARGGILNPLAPKSGGKSSGDAYKESEQKLAKLEGAKADLARYEQDLKAYQEPPSVLELRYEQDMKNFEAYLAKTAAEKAAPLTPSTGTQFQNAAASPPVHLAPVTVDVAETSVPLETKQVAVSAMLEQPVLASSEPTARPAEEAKPEDMKEPEDQATPRTQASASSPAAYDTVKDGGIKTDVNTQDDFQTAARGQAPAEQKSRGDYQLGNGDAKSEVASVTVPAPSDSVPVKQQIRQPDVAS